MRAWSLARVVWVADRGFASAANRAYLTRGGGHYIHAEKRRCCVAEGRAGSTPRRPGSDCECEFGEDRLEPAAGLDVVSEFVVDAA